MVTKSFANVARGGFHDHFARPWKFSSFALPATQGFELPQLFVGKCRLSVPSVGLCQPIVRVAIVRIQSDCLLELFDRFRIRVGIRIDFAKQQVCVGLVRIFLKCELELRFDFRRLSACRFQEFLLPKRPRIIEMGFGALRMGYDQHLKLASYFRIDGGNGAEKAGEKGIRRKVIRIEVGGVEQRAGSIRLAILQSLRQPRVPSMIAPTKDGPSVAW